MGLRIMLLTCALGACSPYGGGAFECSLDNQCSGGTCSDGFCAFPDGNCESGLRYGDLSGPRAGQCVGGSTMMDDAATDSRMNDTAMPDSSDGCYGTGLVTACFTTPPMGAVTVDANVNTDTSPLCDTDPRNAAWCVIAGGSITVANTVTAIGSKPLVLVSTSTLTVNGTLDVGSHRTGGIVGAGAGVAGNCNAGGAASAAGGGGAGGSFGGSGGNGGNRADQANTGGVAGNAVTLTVARGGCAGQSGGGTGNGTGGPGGGAVALIAATSINVVGTVNASGAGGNGAANNSSGGGGGGSGGLVILDAPSIMVTGSVFANGGGGGAGSGSTTPGQPGADPTSANAAAAGGLRGAATFSSFGGSGGAGAFGATAPVTGEAGVAASAGGGGAGGGGIGVVKRYGAASIGGGGLVSPPAS